MCNISIFRFGSSLSANLRISDELAADDRSSSHYVVQLPLSEMDGYVELLVLGFPSPYDGNTFVTFGRNWSLTFSGNEKKDDTTILILHFFQL